MQSGAKNAEPHDGKERKQEGRQPEEEDGEGGSVDGPALQTFHPFSADDGLEEHGGNDAGCGAEGIVENVNDAAATAGTVELEHFDGG